METIATILRSAAERLEKAGIPEPRREASSLLEIALGRDRTFVLSHPEYCPADRDAERFNTFVDRRAAREPFHYIKGTKEFYGLEFAVSPAVLIPRPETEMLVERALKKLSGMREAKFCEVGVGSGCISIAILVNAPLSAAVGLEISDAAATVARANAARHNVGARFDLRGSDVFEALNPGERFDLIVSNPPYVPAADIASLQPEVRDHEPETALTDGDDGLAILERIVAGAPDHLNPGGLLLLEFGIGQDGPVQGLFERGPWGNVAIDADFQGIPRTASAKFGKS